MYLLFGWPWRGRRTSRSSSNGRSDRGRSRPRVDSSTPPTMMGPRGLAHLRRWYSTPLELLAHLLRRWDRSPRALSSKNPKNHPAESPGAHTSGGTAGPRRKERVDGSHPLEVEDERATESFVAVSFRLRGRGARGVVGLRVPTLLI